MSFSLVPQYSFRNVCDITPDFLKRLGVRFLMLDLDNTIAAYDECTLPHEMLQWVDTIRNFGVELFLVSNSLRKERVGSFAKALGVSYVLGAAKPSPKNLLQAMISSGFDSSQSAFVGDQIFTDTLAANRAGVISIIVRPIRFTNIFLALRYWAEAPLRALCKNKG